MYAATLTLVGWNLFCVEILLPFAIKCENVMAPDYWYAPAPQASLQAQKPPIQDTKLRMRAQT